MGRDEPPYWQSSSVRFQLTRPHGARLVSFFSDRAYERFNSRARMGRDKETIEKQVINYAVSTHAPAWGATSMAVDLQTFQQVSTHAPAWGATSDSCLSGKIQMFQLTRPHGARHCDRATTVSPAKVSTHAPAWGATLP